MPGNVHNANDPHRIRNRTPQNIPFKFKIRYRTDLQNIMLQQAHDDEQAQRHSKQKKHRQRVNKSP